MKLYLSSFRLGDNPQELASLFSENKTIAVILNAKDNYHSEHRHQRLLEELLSLSEIGLQPEEVDLKNYFGSPEALAQKLDTFGGVWVVGGNSFVLRAAMRESGFDKWIMKKVDDDSFVYAGYSSGICVLAPTLHGMEYVDNPAQVQNAYKKPTTWEGLHLVNNSFAPHYRSNHSESGAMEKVVLYFQEQGMAYKTLTDGEILISKTEKPH